NTSYVQPASRYTPMIMLCVFYIINLGPLCADGARLRCGSELLGDLIFVCGDRGIYLGKRGWSGYGPRPRGRGIVDQCCLGPGCDLHHLEKYCAKAKDLSTTTTSSSTQAPTQFQALFQKKLVERLGVPGSPHRDAYRKSSKPSEHRPLTTPHRRTRMRGSTGYPSADPSSSTNS
uniref:Insulin-like domain-containing protein n=1 Tax=Periophthalmus magnuspinnatus TaxID=409849 RepID=A0A3B3ZJP6_9GOBI